MNTIDGQKVTISTKRTARSLGVIASVGGEIIWDNDFPLSTSTADARKEAWTALEEMGVVIDE